MLAFSNKGTLALIISVTMVEYLLYASKSLLITMALRHKFNAARIGIAEWIPKALASRLQDATTPLSLLPPIRTGLPISFELRKHSTDTKKVSRSKWVIWRL